MTTIHKIPSLDEDTAVTVIDPYDPAALRLNQDFEATAGVKVLTIVPVRRPDRQWFFRVHPDESYRLQTAVLEIKEDRETYLVARELWPNLAGEIVCKTIFSAINRDGVFFLWPVKLPSADDRNDWARSEMEAAEMGMRNWIRSKANMGMGGYEVTRALGDLPDPDWPDLGFSDVLKIAFRDRFIQTLDHPVVRRLQGKL